MYKKADAALNFLDREKEILEFWKQNGIFNKSIEMNEGGKEFTFYDGPPTANGKPHIGHILTRVMKDIIPRYKTMKGYHVLRKAGWDTHGLPVELEVEKSLGLDGKQDIEKYGMEEFISKCKESVWKYQSEWERMSERVGYWVDMDHPYITYDDNYIESVWWSLKEIFDKGLIYKGHKIVPYCPRCGTALSSHEVAQGYKDVKEKSVVAKFKSKSMENTYFLAWTTTPWTLPSNVALCVNPDENYALIEHGGVNYILAENLVKVHFTDGYKTVSVKKGKEYEGEKYEPLFSYVKDDYDAWFVTADNFVTLTDGTGIVHIAPAFGEDDAQVGKKYNLPFVQLVDERGRFTPAAPDLSGVFAKDADKLIIAMLKERGLLFSELMFEHSYPYCWRCDTPLLYYARSTWFIKMSQLKDRLVKNNATINWYPESIGKGRFGNFLENVIDWGLSRERYWGTPLPIWVCECGHLHAIGSKAELKERGGIKGGIELHKPYVDNVKIKCDKCGKDMKRTPEVIDCWYDSGSMPFAQLHYPFENKEQFEKNFPADFISEAVDQTRGWFYTLLAISTLLFDKAPFNNCIVLGHVGDKDGVKMSKHKGNVVDPWSVLDKQGADAVRWYFYTSSAPWLPSKFYDEAVSEAQRKFMGTLWNTYSFFVLYADIDKFDPTKYNLDKCRLSVMDKWLLSELNTLIGGVDGMLDKYQIFESARAIGAFTDRLSNWYVRRCRDRYWGSEMTEDKIAAYMTLHHTLLTLSKLIAPYTPFIAESIYTNILPAFDKNAPISVHLAKFPKADKKYINKTLEKGMDAVMKIVNLGRSARNTANIKNRQPLSEVMVAGTGIEALPEDLLSVAREELNIKKLTLINEAKEFVDYEVKPQLKTLGPKYGALLGSIRTHLAAAARAIVETVRSGKKYLFKTDGGEVELTEDDLLISLKNKAGYTAESADGVTVVLDTALTEELITEGDMREFISKIQAMRKEAGFNITDHIRIGYSAGDKIRNAVDTKKEEILADTLADAVFVLGAGGDSSTAYIKKWDINGEEVTLSVERV